MDRTDPDSPVKPEKSSEEGRLWISQIHSVRFMHVRGAERAGRFFSAITAQLLRWTPRLGPLAKKNMEETCQRV